ncbi:MAG: peptidase E [Flavobacteriaceae bacterium]|nr:peptidase E [Bacteroidia bacterium]NNK81677.1 peptidase E [Flavobacteriaceae bacterium]
MRYLLENNQKAISKIAIASFFFLLLSTTAIHKYYLSITQMDYIEEKESLQITSRIFIEDLEHVLNDVYGLNLTLDLIDESKKADFYIERYLLDRLIISVDNSQVELKYLGKVYENDQLICYIEVENLEKLNTIQVSNKILFNEFEDQKNVIRITKNNKTKSFIQTRENNKDSVTFVNN